MSLKLFVDHASQPARAVMVFCKINKIPHEIVEVRVSRGDHLTEAYRKVNPLRMVPAIQHGQFCLAQSHSILRYLANTFKTADQWYSRTDLQRAAKVDQYLDYHHTGTRSPLHTLLLWKCFAPFSGKPIPKSFDESESLAKVQHALSMIEGYFLGKTPYINAEQPSIADLSAYQEVQQLKFMDYSLARFSNLQKWIARMETIPEVTDENVIFNKIVRAFKTKQKR